VSEFDSGMQSTQDEEMDFSGDGITKGEYELTITDAETDEKDNGVQVKVTFETPNVAFPIPVGYWTEHTNPKAAAAGRGQLKRIFSAVLGQPKGALSALKGKKVLATVSEDAQGFARISGFKPVPKAVEAVNL
jgi:hypothetical protein